jgi:hypothetical protein
MTAPTLVDDLEQLIKEHGIIALYETPDKNGKQLKFIQAILTTIKKRLPEKKYRQAQTASKADNRDSDMIRVGYNQALSDVIDSLTNKEEL